METYRASKECERVHLTSSPLLFSLTLASCSTSAQLCICSAVESHLLYELFATAFFLDHTLHTKKRFSGKICCVFSQFEGEYPHVLIKHFHAPTYPVLYIYASNVFILSLFMCVSPLCCLSKVGGVKSLECNQSKHVGTSGESIKSMTSTLSRIFHSERHTLAFSKQTIQPFDNYTMYSTP